MRSQTIPARILAVAAQYPETPAYYVKAGGSWRATTWRRFVDEIRIAARALISLGFVPGAKLAILGANRPEWVILDHAAMMAGGVGVGVYTTSTAAQVKYVLRHSEAMVVLVENAEQWAKVRSHRDELPNLIWVVTMRGAQKIDDPRVLSWEEFSARASSTSDDILDTRLHDLKQDELATLIYTSGTTGSPRAVMLSHHNLAWTAQTMIDMGAAHHGDVGISYLPLSQIAEQMLTIHIPASSGASVYFADSFDSLIEDLKDVQPTVFTGVPRIWEKLHAILVRKLGRETSVVETVKGELGLARARWCVSGAAPIDKDVLELFASVGILVQELYGQSEGSGPTSFNRPGLTRLGSVGMPLPGVETKIAKDGEILVRGPNVFLGYYKDPDATRETLVDGWLYSGDLGKMDEDGYLFITGRKKEIIITAGGKNIAPKPIENAIRRSPLVREAVLIGDRRRFLTAVVTLHDEEARVFLNARGLGGDPCKSSAVRAEIQRAVDEVNGTLARVEQIKNVTVLNRQFSIETGELTPTLKVRRDVVYRNFASEIDAMYID